MMCELEHKPLDIAQASFLALLTQESESGERQAIACLVDMLSSRDPSRRERGYALFREGLENAFFQSCLNYSALVHGFGHPLLSALEDAIERWALSSKPSETGHEEGPQHDE